MKIDLTIPNFAALTKANRDCMAATLDYDCAKRANDIVPCRENRKAELASRNKFEQAKATYLAVGGRLLNVDPKDCT